MFYLNYIKAEPTTYLIQYRDGEIIKQGAGIAFYYFEPTASIISVPLSSVNTPFVFRDSTTDFQEITIQGNIIHRIVDAHKISQVFNYSIDAKTQCHVCEDPMQLAKRIVEHIQVLTRSVIQTLALKDALQSSDTLVGSLRQKILEKQMFASLGIEVLDLSILSIKPTPETARALEADAREQLLKNADEAIYARRNAAIEQERAIKESELNSEIAVEQKKREIRETQINAQRAEKAIHLEIAKDTLTGEIELEVQKQQLIDVMVDNNRKEADSKAYNISSAMKAFSDTDSNTLQTLASVGMKPEQLMTMAFQELARNVSKVGQLNITPDLLREIMGRTSHE